MTRQSLLIHIDDISFAYGEISLFSHISLDISRGDICVITGPSWSGKTTLLSLIWGIIKPKTGSIQYNSLLIPRDVWFGYGLIDGPFFETLTVRENVFLLEGFANIQLDREYYKELLHYFELDAFELTPVISLSAGQRERVNFVRSLVHKPSVVILDEPGVNLDAVLFEKLISCIKDTSMKNHTAFVIVSHDPRILPLATNLIQLSPHS